MFNARHCAPSNFYHLFVIPLLQITSFSHYYSRSLYPHPAPAYYLYLCLCLVHVHTHILTQKHIHSHTHSIESETSTTGILDSIFFPFLNNSPPDLTHNLSSTTIITTWDALNFVLFRITIDSTFVLPPVHSLVMQMIIESLQRSVIQKKKMDLLI